MQKYQLHVNFQLPTKHTRVGYLIDNIINPDPDLQVTLGNICLNQVSIQNDFEAAVVYMLPVCPYMKLKNPSSSVPRATVSELRLKGKNSSNTRVDLCRHTNYEYAALTLEQKKELYQWQQTKDGKVMI